MMLLSIAQLPLFEKVSQLIQHRSMNFFPRCVHHQHETEVTASARRVFMFFHAIYRNYTSYQSLKLVK